MTRFLRAVVFLATVFAAATPANASSISLIIGDKDGFGLGLQPGDQIPCLTAIAAGFVGTPDPYNPNHPPCLAPIHDLRSVAEQLALTGAQLTDVYSALYTGTESDCPTGCSPNGSTGTIVIPFTGILTGGSITMFMGDFQSSDFGAMSANINGVPISFIYDHGFRATALETIALTPAMLAAANAAGELRLFLDHTSFWDGSGSPNTFGSFDYVAFDYFELNAEVVPEPGTWLLLATGLAALATRRLRAKTRR
jgi:hypothetical protein